MPTMPTLSKTAYQKRRLDDHVEKGRRQFTYSIAHFCVDFTIENPLFSRV